MLVKITILGRIESHKLKYFSYTSRHTSLEKDITLGLIARMRHQGGQ